MAQHELLSVAFLDYVIEILSEFPLVKDDAGHTDNNGQVSPAHHGSELQQAALVAMATFLRYVQCIDYNHEIKSKHSLRQISCFTGKVQLVSGQWSKDMHLFYVLSFCSLEHTTESHQ